MEEHYFTADPATPFKRVPVRTNVWGHWLELTSGSGVFAQGRLDIGTGVLLREAAPPEEAREVLDLGCGYGVIGLAVAVAVPEARVTAVDVNERALLLARENAEQLGVSDRFTAALPDEVDPEATYDEIWSNPPIRVGKDALHELLLRWLPRLRPGGRALMVVGKNLGSDSLAGWLGEQGYPTEKLASAKGFRVLESPAEPESVDEPQRLQRAGAYGAPGVPLEGAGDLRLPLVAGRERESPLVGGQQLRQQLGAGAVPVTTGPVNVHAHRRLLPGAARRGPRRRASCWRRTGRCRRGARRRRVRRPATAAAAPP